MCSNSTTFHVVSFLVLILPSLYAFSATSSNPLSLRNSLYHENAPMMPSSVFLCEKSKTGAHRQVKLFLSDPEKDGTSEEKEKDPPLNSKVSKTSDEKTPIQKAKWGFYLFYSNLSTFLGVALTCGLVLNLFGYGYVFSKEEGLKIDTLEHLRTENQFRYVSRQYQREYSEANKKTEIQPPSSLPQ